VCRDSAFAPKSSKSRDADVARRLSITRAVVRPDRLRHYLDASELYRTAAERAGGHFWLFADDSAANTYFEFREAADAERLAAIEAAARAIDPDRVDVLRECCATRDAVAVCREVPSEAPRS